MKSFNQEIVNKYCMLGPEIEIGYILMDKTNMDNFLVTFYKVKYTSTLWLSNSTSRYLPKSHEYVCAYMFKFRAVLAIITKPGNNLKIINMKMEEQCLVYSYNVLLLFNNREQASRICTNRKESQRHRVNSQS